MTTKVFGDKSAFTAAPAARALPVTPPKKSSTSRLLIVLAVIGAVVFLLVRSGTITLP